MHTMLAHISPARPPLLLPLPAAPWSHRPRRQAQPGTALAAPMQALAFDAVRHRYARAVTAGLTPRSLIASGRLERMLDALETMALGPLARRR